MIVKPYHARSEDIDALTALATRHDCTSLRRTQIAAEIRKIRAGHRGEREAAYTIDFYLKQRDDWAVIHDLRLEWQGRVAQIDHLLINRMLDMWVCESKQFSEGVSINAHGEFTAFFNNNPRGIESPIEQNQRHIKVLETVLGSSILPLPTRLGVALRPTIRGVVLVGSQARVTRPDQPFPGLETVIKSDQLRTTINKTVEAMGVAETFLKATKIVSTDTLENFARALSKLHRPSQFDWAARLGMSAHEPSGTYRANAPEQRETPRPRASAPIKISTSKLANQLGFPSARVLLERLTTEGLLSLTPEGHVLTSIGKDAGGELVETGRYSPYFVWPPDLRVGSPRVVDAPDARNARRHLDVAHRRTNR